MKNIKNPVRPKQARWKTILTIATFVALAALVFALRKQIGNVVDNLGKVNTWALLLMIPMQVGNYHAYGRLYQSFYALLGETIDYKNMVKVSLELNFINNVFPSGGVSGVSYFSLRMKSFGISSTKSTLVQVMKFALIFISFQILLFIGLFLLALRNHASNLTILVAGSLATLLLVFTLLGIYVIGSRSRINNFLTSVTKLLNRVVHLIRPSFPETINIERAQIAFDELHENYLILQKNWRSLGRPLRFALLANFTEIMTIYVVYIAFGHYLNIGAVIIAYAIANFAGMVSVLPGGIGIYEALMTAVLATAGVKPELSIPVTIMYRVLNMLIQLPPGYYLYHKFLSGSDHIVREK